MAQGKTLSSLGVGVTSPQNVPRSDETKLKAIEIAAILQERFAFLSGAQAKNGSLIVTLPEYPKFADINERDTEKVFKYLVSLVSEGQLKNGFILVLDRRKDKWNAVKGSLHRIQKCFPGTINTILVLKPQGFFQKYSKPSFLTDGIISERRIEVNCLNSPSDLEEHIDNSQLTADLGGSLDYNHTQWVQHRTAIERREGNLASFEKRIEGLRQTYSGTKLSSSVEEVEQLLQAQEDMWRDLKEDMTSDRETGATLLDCIHPKKRNGDENSFTPDIKANAAELKRILNRLDEMKENFEKYWKEHKQRIQYSLKVCVFELEINQTTRLLLTTVTNVTAMADVGDSRESAETLLNALQELDKKSEELVDRAKGQAAKGLKMIESNNQSKEAIRLKCNEIRQLCDQFDKAVKKREEDLKKAVDIHECLEMVSKWCKTGVDLLASQPVDRFQSSEGAEKALEEIDNFLKNPQGTNLRKVNKMEHMSRELGNKGLMNKVKDALKRISEVNDMVTKRENSLKKLVVKRPVQPVVAIPASPTKIDDSKQKIPSSPVSEKSASKFRKKSTSLQTPTRPVSIVLSPDGPLSPAGFGVRPAIKSLSEPNMQRDEVDNRADNPDAPKKRMQVMMELIGTEKDYVSDLGCVINGYLKEFDQAGKKIPADLHGKKNIIFGNIEQIYEFHQHEFLCELESCLDQPSLVGGVFIGKSDEFEMYATYCKNKPTSEALRYEYMNLPFFKECQMRLGHRLPLNAYLLKPVQRITKYQLLLNEMMKYTEHSSWRYADLEKALETMKNVLRHVNDVMHSCGLKGFPGNIAEQGKLLLQDSFMVWQRHKNFNLAPLKGKQRQVFLYQKVLILSKKDEETRKETVLYHYKNSVKMCDVGMTETVPDAPNKFELWMEGRSEVFVLQAMSFEVKNRWVTMIRNVLLSQFNEVKEAVSEQSGLHDRWKSNPAISTRPSNSSPQQLRSRSQSYLSIASATHGSNRYSDILERPGESENDTENEDVDDFDSDEFSESDDGENPSSSDVPEIKYSEDPQPLYAQDTSYEGTRYSAIADYTAVESTELSFVKGDTLEVLRVGQEGWWFARLTPLSQGGWVPASYLELQMSTS